MIKDFFGGRATFDVQGCDFLLLNRLRAYSVRDVTFDKGVNCLRFTVPLRNMSHVRAVLARHNYSVRVNKNLLGLVNVFYSRVTLGVAVVVALVAFFVLNGFVFSVKIIGVEGDRAKQVAQFVHAQGMRPLLPKNGERVAEVAGEIIGNFDFVAHASGKIVGNSLIFNVYAVTMPEGETENSDITATEDGLVTNLIVASGRAMVEVGDVVRAGQVLIKAERQVGAIDVGRDEFGRLVQDGVYVPSRAVGQVLADVKYSEFGNNTTADELLARIVVRTGIQNFDRVEQFSAGAGMLEVVVTVNKSIV